MDLGSELGWLDSEFALRHYYTLPTNIGKEFLFSLIFTFRYVFGYGTYNLQSSLHVIFF